MPERERETAGIPATAFERIREIRASHPESIAGLLESRRRRPVDDGDGRLLIIAADHPARGALGVRNAPMAMASRYELLERLMVALGRPGVDGVLGTPDIIEDLAMLGALEGKIVVGSMNRGGLRGASFEMDDRYTAYDVASLVRFGLDFGKALIRINLQDPGSARTLEQTARMVTLAAEARLPILLEPFQSTWTGDGLVNDLSPDAVITSIAIASGLGASSAYTWLKLPVVAEMERVMDSTTLPTLLLGGDPSGAPEDTYASWARALKLPGVRGLIVGRTLLYPPGDGVAEAVDLAAALVHASGSPQPLRIERLP